MRNRGSSTSTPSNEFRMYVPYDEYIYRKISDLCLDFVNTYKELESDDGLTVTKLENIFEALLDFAQNSGMSLPMELKDPPLKDWELSPDNIHPRYALNYVMRLLNELKRQQDKSGRDPNHYVKGYLTTKKESTVRSIPEPIPDDV